MHLAKLLASIPGNEVAVTTRADRKNTEHIRYLKGNGHNDAFLEEVMSSRYDCIVNFLSYNTEAFQLQAKRFLNATAQYVHLSSSRVYAESQCALREDSPRLLDVCRDPAYLATDEYALTKARQEDILTRSGQNNFTIVRPYITYDENRLQLGPLEKETWLRAALDMGLMVLSEDIAACKTTLTYGADVSRGIASLLGKQKALGEAFHITCGHSLTWAKVFSIYQNVLLERGVMVDCMMKPKSHRLAGNGRWQVLKDRYYNRLFDNTKISSFLDVTNFVPPEKGLKECLKTFLESPKFKFYDVRDISGLVRGGGLRSKLAIRKVPGLKNKVKFALGQLI